MAESLLEEQKENVLLVSNFLFMKARLYMDTERSKQGIDLANEYVDLNLRTQMP